MTHIDLSHNELTSIPHTLLELPKLMSLDLSHNKLIELPDVPHWSTKLFELNLSNNCLPTIPKNVSAPGLTSLNLSKNCLNHVPCSVCTFATLKHLNLRDNPNIKTLPFEISMLSNLVDLQLNGKAKESLVYKAIMQENPLYHVHIQNKLREYSKSPLCTQLMIVGNDDGQKYALAAMLQGTKIKHDNSKVTVSEWAHRPNLTKKLLRFQIWIFSSLNNYKATHHWILSKHSLYLLLFNLKLGSEGVHELKPWLDSIAHHAPYSCVIIIGIHNMDETVKSQDDIDILLQQAKMVGATYKNKPEIVALLPFAIKNHPKDVLCLQELVYDHVLNYPFLQKGT